MMWVSFDNTYVIYSTNNGFYKSQHRLPPGKTCGCEEDIHIPPTIRGPSVPKGSTTDIVTAQTDLAPTILSLAGAPPRPDFDDTAIPLATSALLSAQASRQEHVNVEFWGRAVPEGIYGFSVDEGKMRKSLPPTSFPITVPPPPQLRRKATTSNIRPKQHPQSPPHHPASTPQPLLCNLAPWRTRGSTT